MNQKGFTLIELLIVVAIIGVLAAVGVVAFNGFISTSQKILHVRQNKNMTTEKNCSYNNQTQLKMAEHV